MRGLSQDREVLPEQTQTCPRGRLLAVERGPARVPLSCQESPPLTELQTKP